MVSPAALLALTAFVFFAGATTLWFRRIQQVAIPSNRLGFLATWGVAIAVGAMSMFVEGGGWPSTVMAIVAILGSSTFITLYLLGNQRSINPIEVGNTLPAFSASTDERIIFDSTAAQGTPLLIKFFRGHW